MKFPQRPPQQSSPAARPLPPLPALGLLGILLAACTHTTTPESQETWEVFVVRGFRIGYAHTRRVAERQRDLSLIKYNHQFRMRVRRFGQIAQQAYRLTSWEDPQGGLHAFDSQLDLGGQVTRVRGHISKGRLVLTTTTDAGSHQTTLPWRNHYGGFFAVEQSLRRSPLQPGERRRLHAIQPVLNQVAAVQLRARRYELTPVGQKRMKLLRIDVETVIPASGGQSLRQQTTLWADEQGEVWKTQQRTPLGDVAYRTSRSEALAALREAEPFDLGRATIVPADMPHGAPRTTRHARYRLRLASANPAEIISTTIGQRVLPVDDRTAEVQIEVRTLAQLPVDTPADSPASPPTRSKNAPSAPIPRQADEMERHGMEATVPEDLAPNSLVQSDHPRVRRLAEHAAAAAEDPAVLALKLESYVHRRMRARKTMVVTFASAADVAETLSGDCSEHAVLLAAICRARGLPARLAIGLVYSPADRGFAFHMWNEVYIRGRWYPLDATLGQGRISATHIKLADTNLAGHSPLSALLPVGQLLGDVELEVLEIE
jgi:hypothetical protein